MRNKAKMLPIYANCLIAYTHAIILITFHAIIIIIVCVYMLSHDHFNAVEKFA